MDTLLRLHTFPLVDVFHQEVDCTHKWFTIPLSKIEIWHADPHIKEGNQWIFDRKINKIDYLLVCSTSPTAKRRCLSAYFRCRQHPELSKAPALSLADLPLEAQEDLRKILWNGKHFVVKL